MRWGILSTARINRNVIPGIRATPGAELVAVASRDADRARAYAAEWDIPTSFGSYHDLLVSDDVDAVYVPVPNHLHVALTLDAIRAGKHVLCEKPMALDVADVDEVAQAADAQGVVVTEAFMYRHHALTHTVRRLVDDGRIGEVRLVRGSFSFVLDRDDDVRWDPTMGGGSCWDVGCYPVSYARTLIDAAPVEAQAFQRASRSGVDVALWGTLRFANGAVAQVDCAFDAPFRTNIEVVGTEGVIVVPSPFKPTASETVLVGPASDLFEPVPVEGDPELYRGEVADLEAAARGERAPTVSLADTRENTAAILALLASARNDGHPVPVPA